MASLNEDALSVWSTIAPDWDASMGQDGNEYWEVLEKPSLERMFEEKRVQAGSAASPAALRALDISTGNGLTSRWLALFLGGGVEVTATDGSMAMLERARSRAADAGLQNVRFAKLDVSQPVDFAPFIEEAQARPFDAILMNMAIMDVPTLEPLAAALPQLLPAGGVFVGSLLHPVFFTSRAHRTIEVIQDYDDDGADGADGTASKKTANSIRRSYRIDRYLHVPPWRGFAVAGQARAQYYFHRPLHDLLGVFLRGGQLALDALEEPAFGPEHKARVPRLESTKHFTEFPPIFVFRLRRIK